MSNKYIYCVNVFVNKTVSNTTKNKLFELFNVHRSISFIFFRGVFLNFFSGKFY